MEDIVILERREYEGIGQVYVKKLGGPITQTVMDLIRFRVKTSTELRYFEVDKDEYLEHRYEIERILENWRLDATDLDAYGVTEIKG